MKYLVTAWIKGPHIPEGPEAVKWSIVGDPIKGVERGTGDIQNSGYVRVCKRST